MDHVNPWVRFRLPTTRRYGVYVQLAPEFLSPFGSTPITFSYN